MGRNLRLAVAVFAVSVAMVSTVAVGVRVRRSHQPGGSNILPPVGNSQPVTGGTLKIVGSGDVDHLDTCCAYYTTTYEMLRMVSRQLVSYKASYAAGADGTPVPDMATYTISPNKLVYTFHDQAGCGLGHADRSAAGDVSGRGARDQAPLQPGLSARHRSPTGPTTSPA